MKKQHILAFTGFLIILGMIMLWTIDVSVTGIIDETRQVTLEEYGIEYHVPGKMTNGFFKVSPLSMYHICLYILIIIEFSFFLLILKSLFLGKV